MPVEEQLWDFLTHNLPHKGVHAFLNGICSKGNVIPRLEFELTDYQQINNYTTTTHC